MTARDGAYGLRFSGPVGDLLIEAPEAWPMVSISQRVGDVNGRSEEFAEDEAELALVDGWASLVRQPATVNFTFQRAMTEGEIAHPFLTRAAAAHTYWLRRESFHAGAFLANGKAWAVAADREGGKSSTLAGLALAGLPVLVDDLVVTRDTTMFAGPRSIDLREGAAGFLEAGESMGIHGGRARFRLRLDPVPAEIEVGGWVFLEWSDTVEAVVLEPFDRLQHLMGHRMVKGPAQLPPEGLLGLAALPGYVLKRPKSFAAFEESLAALLSVAV